MHEGKGARIAGGGGKDARGWPLAGGRVCVWAFVVNGFTCMQIDVGLKMPSLSMTTSEMNEMSFPIFRDMIEEAKK